MGYAYLLCDCVACFKPIMCNPNLVPSLRVKGVKQPICRKCAERWNTIHRTSNGLEPVPIEDGAYDPCNELEL